MNRLARTLGALFVASLASGVPVRAQGTQAPASVSVPSPERPLASAVRIDGDLNEQQWTRAEPIQQFVQRDPDDGGAPTERTEARVLYDNGAIYVAVRAFDSRPDQIKAFLTRRDTGSSSDWIRIYIDSYHDRRSAYSFAVNPVGVKLDTYHFNDTDQDDGWDAVWDVAVSRDAGGWRAEFRIPLSQLRFTSGGDGRLGFAVARNLARLNETSTWPRISKAAVGWVSTFGDLSGVTRQGATKRLELMPYVVEQVRTTPPQSGNPLHHSPDPSTAIGADLKYAVTPALSLTATVNPDFGQVEADPAVVNLGAFEVFFQERRPFFVEGSGTYAFDCRDCSLFYSRRIGRAPRGTPTLASGEFQSRPEQSTILGAGKLTGRAHGFSLGMMTAATQQESAQIAFGPGLAPAGTGPRREVVEPLTFYSVSRAKREFSDQSTLGFILTTTSRRLADSVSFLPDGATTGGVDFDWRLGRRWGLNGYWAGSHVAGSTTAIAQLQRSNVHSFQRPDADHVELDLTAETLRGHSANISVGKIGGQRTRGNVNIGYRSPGFDTNDVGFLQRADQISQNAWVQIRWDVPGRFTRNIRLNFNQWSSHNFDGDRLDLGGNVNAHWQFKNQWSAGFGFNVNAGGFDDRLTRGGPGGRRPGNVNGWQYVSTNDRLAVSGNFEWSVMNDGNGSRNFSLWPKVVLRPASAVSAEVGLAYTKGINDFQWVKADTDAAGATHFVFGRLAQVTTSVTTRFNYTLTPTLSFQSYAQPFVSGGAYRGYKELVQPMADRHADRFAPYAYTGNADFNVLTFRTTNVLRWEYKPGSAFFVVWQQGREGFTQRGDYRFSRDFGDLFASPSTNALVVKLAYWFNP